MVAAVIINALFYFFLFVKVFKQNNRLGAVESILAVYSIVAITGVFLYMDQPYNWEPDILYYLYLFVVFYIFIKPLTGKGFSIQNKTSYTGKVSYMRLLNIYIIISFYSCIVYIPQVYLVLQNPEWAELYEKSHEAINSNIFIKLANLFFHIRYLGLILFFSYSSVPNKKMAKFILLGISAILPVGLVTILQASRGGIIALLVSIYMSFSIFKNALSPKLIRKFYIVGISLLLISVIYFITVSVGRFEDKAATGYNDVNSSLFSYAGQSMLNFVYGVMDSINRYGLGGYMFDIKDNLKLIRGTHFGTGFITFIGCLYLDFGFWGTLIVALIVSTLIAKIIKIGNKGIPELFVLLTYSMFLFSGVFVVGIGYGQQWMETFIIYFVLKYYLKWK